MRPSIVRGVIVHLDEFIKDLGECFGLVIDGEIPFGCVTGILGIIVFIELFGQPLRIGKGSAKATMVFL